MKRFIFWNRQPRQTEPRPAPPAVRRRELLLLAEDDAVIRDRLATILREDGYRVVEAADGAEALRMFHTELGKIDLVVADMVMPKMNGKELAYRVGEISPKTKIIFASGYPERLAVQHGMVDSRYPFLQKPVSREALTAKVREVLDQTKLAELSLQ